ncbi:Cell division transport system ATP-binding protein [Melioribacter roseus P3M-2]|uniref:Cell division ATP-binding protein FtsE n=1 Tax=Melioribacter roseus (strain DSM 23840 / JCM 17771 / VKM B-2668 / P3M-2) TaxID=1191523 RepID=I6YRT0_MELRP|nr:cell division ATP-binding protein FtsE [Melioribacter roseus]AFN73252.1 Cell division transport system ATP-binding protein [Melioribacter roseus P3M-2]
MLIFNHVDFSYPNQPVFQDLNLQVEQGEFVFLIGKSGIGKSTLLKLIYMDCFPNSGYVQVGEFSSDSIKKKNIPFLRRKIGVIFQDFQLLNDRNVYDNLAFVLEVTGTPRKEIKRRIIHALSEVGLTHKQTNMPEELSGGEKQRVAIARAIINDPFLILADEPTGNLDPETADEILSILKKINSRGTSVIFATHNYELIRAYNAKILKLDNGKAVKVVLKKKEN